MIERDRIWQKYIETFDLSHFTEEEIEVVRYWWFLRSMRPQLKRKRNGRTATV